MFAIEPEGTDGETVARSRPARLAARMREVWESVDPGRTHELFALASEVFDGRARGHLARISGLDLEAVDDCVGESLEILLRKWRGDPASINEPYAYLWSTAKRRVLVMRRTLYAAPIGDVDENEVGADTDDSVAEMSEWSVPDYEVALVWYEELTEETISPEDRGWVREVITLSVRRLPASLRQAVEFMLRPEFDHRETRAKEGSEALGVSEAAFRQNRHRALERLRKVIPAVVEELGIQLSGREAESVFFDRPRLGEEE